ncbi:MAG: hypothetical protein U1E73_09545 [Planctomycetota bacterium]
MTRRPSPIPPQPHLERRPTGAFGWLPAELLHERWLAEVGPHAAALLVLLAIAADHRGASYFGRNRMAEALGMSRHEVDVALQRLLDADLVALRPWRNGCCDGVWQILPVPSRHREPRTNQTSSVADVLRSLGFGPA